MEKWTREREEARKEKELEERLYKRLLDQVMKNISVEVKNEASPAIKQLKNEINSLMKWKMIFTTKDNESNGEGGSLFAGKIPELERNNCS